MPVEVLVFDGDGSLSDVGWEVLEHNRSSVLVGINLVEELAIAIENLGGGWGKCYDLE